MSNNFRPYSTALQGAAVRNLNRCSRLWHSQPEMFHVEQFEDEENAALFYSL
jgi:hypothetical protein